MRPRGCCARAVYDAPMGDGQSHAGKLLDEAQAVLASNPERAALCAAESYALAPGVEAASLASRANAAAGRQREATTWLEAALSHAATPEEQQRLVAQLSALRRAEPARPAVTAPPAGPLVQTRVGQVAGALVGSTYLVEMLHTIAWLSSGSLPTWLRAGLWVLSAVAVWRWQGETRGRLAALGIQTRSPFDLVGATAWAQLDQSRLRLPKLVPPLLKVSAAASLPAVGVLLLPETWVAQGVVLWARGALAVLLLVMVWFINCWSALAATSPHGAARPPA